ncbi:LysR family transcriptional regulator [Virgibacillus pantothenticus]|uniref:LysR family transcriptional regulator n=1 Tax=Virgibacillus pantothenticus TaxID=1473 RepID=UPI001C238352|nr:LysR family transcriptional regulator [Virgibacillus pantothenticus]MBU8568474.1 LysR family transcriptional regulator [Virgibacillus pantothenticus]MBU8599906.1 LysR family transcriptional regulator [Virgibacillus pantothenticus]MBU8636652.1 LysR family transcriptional regulator [Virgibacillus pantothenticus]MBU8642200.1 LysR family transcriptional regulator [Virgibacillus pantothenticus]MBU8646362.1 LysR family transcriptional regulator [Virgibacillus pantothenticus]
MDIKELVIFKTLAHEGNITKAAEQLNYVQSNVTGRVKKLESELQTVLFYRHPRGVSLTSKGKLLLSYTDKILNLMEETKKAIQDSETPHGPLSIGANETTASVRLPAVLVSYNENYPEVELSLNIGETEELISDVLDYKLDGAFVVGPVKHPDIIQTPIMKEELVVITDNLQAPFTFLTDLKKRTLLTRPHCIHRKRLEQWLHDEGIFPLKIMEFGTLEAIIGCVKAGLGVSITTKSLVSHHKMDDQLCYHEIPEKYSTVKTVFIRRKDAFITSAYSKFIEMITQSF